MIADRLKALREQKGVTQAQVAKELGVTRSCVNAWEMGISVPSTQYIVELALYFKTSADYLLEIPGGETVSVEGLDEKKQALVVGLIECLREKRETV